MRTPDPELQRQRSDQIVSAATEAFLSGGFHRTSMQDIASAAGVSMGLLYRYFANKEAIIAAAAERDQSEQVAHLKRVGEAENLVEALLSLARTSLTDAADTRYVALLAEITAESCRNPSIALILQRGQAEARNALCDALRQQQKAGKIRAEIDPSGMAIVLLTLIEGLSVRAVLDPSEDVSSALDSFGMTLKLGLAG